MKDKLVGVDTLGGPITRLPDSDPKLLPPPVIEALCQQYAEYAGQVPTFRSLDDYPEHCDMRSQTEIVAMVHTGAFRQLTAAIVAFNRGDAERALQLARNAGTNLADYQRQYQQLQKLSAAAAAQEVV